MKKKTRKIVLELSEMEFAQLEALAFGLKCEEHILYSEDDIYDKSKNDFAPGVRQVLMQATHAICTGYDRPGSWERGLLSSIYGWEGTFAPQMFAPCLKEDFEQKLKDPVYKKYYTMDEDS